MKTQKYWILIACLVGPALTGLSETQALPKSGYLPIDETLDVGSVHATVNVNLPKFLLNEVVAGIAEDPENPFANAGVNLTNLIKDVTRIRLVVVQRNDSNREELGKATTSLQKELKTNWVPIISVPEQNVGIYSVGDESGTRMGGLALLVIDNDNVVIGNIEGRVPIGSLIMLAARSDRLPKSLLEQLAKFNTVDQNAPAESDPPSTGQ